LSCYLGGFSGNIRDRIGDQCLDWEDRQMSIKIPQPFVIDLGTPVDLDVNAAITIPTQYTIGINQLPNIQINPVDISLRLKEIPSIKVHLPADFRIGLALLGTEILTVRLCGEALAITEPYVPNPCEICGGQGREILDSSIELTNAPAVQSAGTAATGAA
jgi:hypothetical protein